MRSPKLVGLSALLLGVSLLHDLDHVRQGRSLAAAVTWVGIVGLIQGLAAVGLSMSGHRFAAPFCAFVGFNTAAGLVAVHVLPRWSAFSDPYPAVHADLLSWLSVIVMIASGLGLGAAGLGHMRRRQFPRRAAA